MRSPKHAAVVKINVSPITGRTYLYPVGYQLLSRRGWDTYLWPMLVLGTGTLQKPQRRGTMRSIHTGHLNIGPPPFSKLEPRQRTDDAVCHVWAPISRLPGVSHTSGPASCGKAGHRNTPDPLLKDRGPPPGNPRRPRAAVRTARRSLRCVGGKLWARIRSLP